MQSSYSPAHGGIVAHNIYHVLPQEIAFFDVTRTGELLSRLSEDTQIIKNAATTNLSEALRNITTTAIGLGFMFSTSWKLTREYKCHMFIFWHLIFAWRLIVHRSFICLAECHKGT